MKFRQKIKKAKALLKKPKVSKEELNKIGSTIEEIKECPYCADLKKQIKECLESHNVKNNLRSVLKHEIKCSDCRLNIMLISEHKKRGHKA